MKNLSDEIRALNNDPEIWGLDKLKALIDYTAQLAERSEPLSIIAQRDARIRELEEKWSAACTRHRNAEQQAVNLEYLNKAQSDSIDFLRKEVKRVQGERNDALVTGARYFKALEFYADEALWRKSDNGWMITHYLSNHPCTMAQKALEGEQ